MTRPPADTYQQRVATYLLRTGRSKTGASVTQLHGDASDRCYVRVRLPDGSSLILLVHQSEIDTTTLPFLNVARLFTRMTIPIPEVRDTADDLGILVLDDLGDVTVHTFLRTATDAQRRAVYRDAVELIARIQRRGRELASPDYLPFTMAFDVEKLVWELAFFAKHYLGTHRHARLLPAVRTALDEEFHTLAGELASERRVLCHRDYHSRNLMLHDSTLYVIDFQDARLGPNTYDLVSLLRDCYVSLDSSFVAEMVAYYHERVGSSTNPNDPRYLERFDRMSVQRHLKALGTFGYQAAVIGNRSYLDDMPRTLGYLVDVFRRRPRFDRLRTLLAPQIPELR